MALANCKECGKLFDKSLSEYCPICRHQIDEYFNIINDYIYDKGPQPIHVVSNETGIKERWIMQFINDGRLINAKIEYPCQQCGDYIRRGKLCEKCVKAWNDHLKEHEQEKSNQYELETLKGKMYSHRRDE